MRNTRCLAAAAVAAARLILRCGFPPRPIDHAGAKKDQSIATDGLLQNRDMLTIERKPAPDGTAGAAQQPARPTTPRSPSLSLR